MEALKRTLSRRKEKLDARAFKEILCDSNVFVDKKFRSLTIDQLIAVCEDRSLFIRRAGSDPVRGWVKYTL